MDFDFLRKRVEDFQKDLGFEFENTNLLITALSHPSGIRFLERHYNESNQRLEFLGDAVVGLVIGQFFYNYSSDWDEGTLTTRRSLVINGNALSSAAEKLNLHNNLIMSKEENERKGNYKKSNLADAFEALVGAIYLDKGMDFVSRFIITSLEDQIYEALMSNKIKDFKSTLQELTQSKGLGTPLYKLISKKGPSHKPVFETAAILNGVFLSLGSGYRKIDAEMKAAELAYNKIIENQDIDFGVGAKFKSRLKFVLNDLQNSFIGKKVKR